MLAGGRVALSFGDAGRCFDVLRGAKPNESRSQRWIPLTATFSWASDVDALSWYRAPIHLNDESTRLMQVLDFQS